MSTVIFVHGTGTREAAYKEALQRVGQKLLAARADLTIMPCLWGDEQGAVLHRDGASIPEYDTARAVGALAENDYELTLWSILYDDPLYELRLLSLNQAGAFVPGQETPYQQLDAAARKLRIEGVLADQIRACSLAEQWDNSYQTVLASGEYQRALQNAPAVSAEYRLAISRALVAQAQRLTLESQNEGAAVWPDGDARDKLVDLLVEALGGRDRGVGSWIKDQLTDLALRLVTSRAKRKRGALSDASYPFAGDVLLYQARGEGIRDFIRKRVEEAKPPVVIIAHSLGGIACVDLLIEHPLPQVELLVTVGSQASFLYEIDALSKLRFGEEIPGHFPTRWLNIYDLRDFLSYIAEGVFAGSVNVSDVRVDNKQPFPQSHSAYWGNQAVWDAVLKELP